MILGAITGSDVMAIYRLINNGVTFYSGLALYAPSFGVTYPRVIVYLESEDVIFISGITNAIDLYLLFLDAQTFAFMRY